MKKNLFVTALTVCFIAQQQQSYAQLKVGDNPTLIVTSAKLQVDGDNTTTTPSKLIVTGTGNVGVGTAAPGAKLEVNSGTAGVSGQRFTNLNNASTSTAGTAPLGVDASGNVVVHAFTSAFKTFLIDANALTNSEVLIGGLGFRYGSTGCTGTNSFMQIRSTTGSNNVLLFHNAFTSAQAGTTGFVATDAITATATYSNIAALPMNCVNDGSLSVSFFSYTTRTFYRLSMQIMDGDGTGNSPQGYILVEYHK